MGHLVLFPGDHLSLVSSGRGWGGESVGRKRWPFVVVAVSSQLPEFPLQLASLQLPPPLSKATPVSSSDLSPALPPLPPHFCSSNWFCLPLRQSQSCTQSISLSWLHLAMTPCCVTSGQPCQDHLYGDPRTSLKTLRQPLLISK